MKITRSIIITVDARDDLCDVQSPETEIVISKTVELRPEVAIEIVKRLIGFKS